MPAAHRISRQRTLWPLLALLCLLGLLLPLFAGFTWKSSSTAAWLVDLAVHWQWLYAAGLLVFALLSAVIDKRRALLVLAAPLPLLTATPPAPAITDNGATLTVASANVGLGNQQPADILSWLDSQGVEVAALFEVTPAFADQLQASSAFPYTKIIATQDPFGIALLARFPFERVDVLEAMHGITQIEARFRWQEKESRVVAVHPAPPIDPSLMQERDVLLEQRAAGIVADGAPAILLGDLNATPWSAAFKGPTLHGLRRVTGLAPT